MSDIRDNDGLLDTILSVPITLLDARFYPRKPAAFSAPDLIIQQRLMIESLV